jgi:uncharacterized NAD(P)/FAD-binding protein YdhS
VSLRGGTRTVVVGGGCSGTLLAIELASRMSGGVGEVIVVDPAAMPGRGVAYGTSCPSHLLNVRAGQMSAHLDRPGHFAAWIEDRVPGTSARSFAPRMLYGMYLEDAWLEARANAPDGISLTHVRAAARAVHPATRGDAMGVDLDDGTTLEADQVVLAMGNLSLAIPHRRAGIAASSRYVVDPWQAEALDAITGDVLLIGTGLTAIDVAFALEDRGHGGTITALSRHGLLPRAHRRDGAAFAPQDSGVPAERTIRSLTARLRRVTADREDWRDAVDEMRPHVAQLWRELPDVERRRFLRHVSRYWEVHRHRLPPSAANRVAALAATGYLSVRAGAVEAHRDTAHGVEVCIRHRGQDSGRTERLEFAHVINCTGPPLAVALAGDPLLDQLLATGQVLPGPYGLGLDVDADGAILDRNGAPSRTLWAIGPLRRGAEWETTAVREIRAQAVALAGRLSGRVTNTHRVSDHQVGVMIDPPRAVSDYRWRGSPSATSS